MSERKHKILLTGGGTIGSVSPLLSIVELSRKTGQDFDFFWIGTKTGPEIELLKSENIPYKGIFSGKLRRYFDWKNFSDLILIKLGFFQSLYFIWRWQPEIVITAGSFVSVPVIWASALMRKKIIVHQQDVDPGLANRLMAPFADVVTVVFEKSLSDYKNGKWIGNPTRITNLRVGQNDARAIFGLKDDLPVLFITGGGTGASGINGLVHDSIDKLSGVCQVIHQTGKEKGNDDIKNENYHQYDFLSAREMAAALSLADIVVSRSGLGSLTELSAMSKPAILIPMPDSHQESNAAVFSKSEAAIVMDQKSVTSDIFFQEVSALLHDDAKKLRLSQNIGKVMKTGAGEAFMDILKKLI